MDTSRKSRQTAVYYLTRNGVLLNLIHTIMARLPLRVSEVCGCERHIPCGIISCGNFGFKPCTIDSDDIFFTTCLYGACIVCTDHKQFHIIEDAEISNEEFETQICRCSIALIEHGCSCCKGGAGICKICNYPTLCEIISSCTYCKAPSKNNQENQDPYVDIFPILGSSDSENWCIGIRDEVDNEDSLEYKWEHDTDSDESCEYCH